MHNSDLTRIINSDEIQSTLNPIKSCARTYHRHKDPLRNLGVRVKLNPYALALRRQELATAEHQKTARAALLEAKRKGVAKDIQAAKLKLHPSKVSDAKADKNHRKAKAKNYSNLHDDSQFALSTPNAAHTGGFNVPDPKTAPQKAEA